MKNQTVIDGAGRIIIPKPIRDKLRLGAGDALRVESVGDHLILKPVRATAPLRKESGVWVYRTGIPFSTSTSDLIDEAREERGTDLA